MDKHPWEPEWAGVTITEWARDIASLSQREQESGLNTVLFVAKMLFVVNKPEKKTLFSQPTLQFIQPWHRLRTANKVRLHWVADAMGLKLAQVWRT